MEWSGPPDPASRIALSVLIYARAKAGKSRLIASAPGPVLVWDFDGNFPQHAVPAGKVAIERALDYAMYRRQLLKLQPAPGGFGVLYEGTIFNTVGMDTLTNLYSLIMDDVLKMPVKREVGNIREGDAVTIEGQRGREIAVTQDFLLAQERLKDLIRLHKQLPCHFVAAGHEEIYEVGSGASMEGGKKPVTTGIYAGISLTHKLNTRVPGLFNLWLRINVNNPGGEPPQAKHYEVWSSQNGWWPAGDFTGLLAPVEPADLTAIIRKAGGWA